MSMPDARKADQIAQLRRQIAGLGAVNGRAETGEPTPQTINFGGAQMWPELACGALHEVQAADYRDMSTSIGFAAALAVCCAHQFSDAPVLWCESTRTPFDVGQLYGPGLAAFGLDPARLIFVTPSCAVDLLWTMEEALRLGAFAAVFGEIDGRAPALTLTATRRLQLAAEVGGRPAFLLTGHATSGTSAAATRWEVTAAPSLPTTGTATLVGRTRWRIRLVKHRSALTGSEGNMVDRDWCVEWDAQQKKLCEAPDQRKPVFTPASKFMQAV